jgi:hypothetical protein
MLLNFNIVLKNLLLNILNIFNIKSDISNQLIVSYRMKMFKIRVIINHHTNNN